MDIRKGGRYMLMNYSSGYVGLMRFETYSDAVEVALAYANDSGDDYVIVSVEGITRIEPPKAAEIYVEDQYGQKFYG